MSQPPHHVTGTTSPTQLGHAPAPRSNIRATTAPPLSASVSLPNPKLMGSGSSKPAPPLPPPSPGPSAAAKGINAAVAGGIKLKRAFAGRRKKSEDTAREKEQDSPRRIQQQQPSVSPSSWIPQRMDTSPGPSPSQILDKSLVISPTQAQSIPSPSSPAPPPPPKKQPLPTLSLPPDNKLARLDPLSAPAGNRNSVIPLSPGISSAVNYMMQESNAQDANGDRRELKESWRKSDSTNSHHTIRPGGGGSGNGGATSSARTSRPVSWAESFQSAHTVVQGASSNKRLSALIGDADFGMAEEDDEDSDSSSSSECSSTPAPARKSESSTSSLPPSTTAAEISAKNKNRRSMSLSVGMSTAKAQQQQQYHQHHPSLPSSQPNSASAADLKFPSYSISEGVPARQSQYQHPQHLPRPPMISQSSSSPPANTQGRLRQDQQLPPLPPTHSQTHPYPHTQAPTRQLTPSMSSSSAASSSAGFGFAKRAVEKMGKKWGSGMGNMVQNVHNMSMAIGGYGGLAMNIGNGGVASSSASGSGSGYSSSASASSRDRDRDGSSSLSLSGAEYGSDQQHHSGSGPGSHGKAQGAMHSFLTSPSNKGMHAPKGSISSTASTSDSSDMFGVPSGPTLGWQLRAGRPGARMVFKRDLRDVVRETSVRVGKAPSSASSSSSAPSSASVAASDASRKPGLLGELEDRCLPALVVRCAQHVLVWGVQEEGLFRVSGRPAHVSVLRKEFDSGADWDMTGCTPGDLDPHAVASVFKAFLRELPEPVLTHKLQPVFDAAISKETQLNADAAAQNPQTRMALKPGQGLPTGGPKGGFGATALRKPPSLSTLAMPTFNGLPPPSKSLVAAFRDLIAQLPEANRDLLHTVVDLIKATAKCSKETKMPLSNLLLVFTPSLNMTPPLLKVLCEAEGIWGGGDGDEVEDEEAVIDIRRRTVVVSNSTDAKLPPTSMKDTKMESDEESISSSRDDVLDEEEDSIRSARASLDNPSSDYHASAEDDTSSSFYDDRGSGAAAVAAVAATRRRREGQIDRHEVPTVYLDTRSHLSSSSASSLQDDEVPPTSRYGDDVDASFAKHSRDAAADDGSISSGPSMNSQNHYAPPGSHHLDSPSPPPLSSSADSISTPTSSNASFSHLPLEAIDVKDVKDKEHPHHQIHQRHALALEIAEPAPLEVHSLPTPQVQQDNKRPAISSPIPIATPTPTGPVQFPATWDSPARRRSIPALSFPASLGYSSEPPSAQSSPREAASPQGEKSLLRAKKPSLKLLFSKRSASSLNIDSSNRASVGLPFISPPLPHYADRPSPRSASDSSTSVSTPLSAVTAPQWSRSVSLSGSKSSTPPVLDTPIEDGSLRFDHSGFDLGSPATATLGSMKKPQEALPPTPSTSKPSTFSVPTAPLPHPHLTKSQTMPMPINLPIIQPLSIISRKSSDSGRGLNTSATQQQVSSPELVLRPQHSTSNLSIVSTASSHRLSLFEDDEDAEVEDWTQSVLQAAAVGGVGSSKA